MIFICFLKGWKNQEKEKSLGLVFDHHFYSYSKKFPQEFFFVFLISKLFVFLTLELSYLSSLLGSCLVRKLVCGLLIPPRIVKPSIICDIPLVRGDCGGLCWNPSKCRGNCWSVR